jgi:hypothetical protein
VTSSKSCHERIQVVSAMHTAPNAAPMSSAAGTTSSAHQDETSPIASITSRKPAE